MSDTYRVFEPFWDKARKAEENMQETWKSHVVSIVPSINKKDTLRVRQVETKVVEHEIFSEDPKWAVIDNDKSVYGLFIEIKHAEMFASLLGDGASVVEILE